jgi:hypothetical protein
VFATTMEWKCGKNIMEETIMKRLELWEIYLGTLYIYLDKIRVIDGEIEYYYGKTLEKINKMEG